MLEHNDIGVALVGSERCCGMPKLELGDLKSIEKLKEANIDELDRYARDGWDLTAVVPSCVLDVQAGAAAVVPRGRARAARRRGVLRSVRVPDAAAPRRQAPHEFRDEPRQDQLSGAVPSARAERRAQDARRAAARARHGGASDRALLGPRRHLRREEGVRGRLAQDRAARRAPGRQCRGAALHERLPDGGGADRGRRGVGREPTHPIQLLRKAYGI